MNRTFVAVMASVAVLAGRPAAGQTPTASGAGTSSAPTVNLWYAGVNTGVAVVEKSSGVFGGEVGIRVVKNVDILGEATWIGNAATNRQSQRVGTLAAEIQRLQGGTAAGSMKVPTIYGGVGARYVFEGVSAVRPYVIVTVGAARTELKPTITLNGSNVTGSVGQYGVTLGQDVIGKYRRVAFSGGFGVLKTFGTFYFDGGVRVVSVEGQGQRTNAARLVLGGGYRF